MIGYAPEAYEEDRQLRPRAEMKSPGHAWLAFEFAPADRGRIVRPTARCDPSGPRGRVHWNGILPLRALLIRGMPAGNSRAARSE